MIRGRLTRFTSEDLGDLESQDFEREKRKEKNAHGMVVEKQRGPDQQNYAKAQFAAPVCHH
jgi:hypothetical protein